MTAAKHGLKSLIPILLCTVAVVCHADDPDAAWLITPATVAADGETALPATLPRYGCAEAGAFLLPVPLSDAGTNEFVLTGGTGKTCAFSAEEASAAMSADSQPLAQGASLPQGAAIRTGADLAGAPQSTPASATDANANSLPQDAPQETTASIASSGQASPPVSTFAPNPSDPPSPDTVQAQAKDGASHFFKAAFAAFYRQMPVILFIVAAVAVLALLGTAGFLAYLHWFDKRAVLARAINRGLKRNEFYLEYQPVFYARTRKCIGLEVLLGWKNLAHGVRGESWYTRLVDRHTAMKLMTFVLATVSRELDGLNGDQRLYAMVNLWAPCLGSEECLAQIAAVARSWASSRLVFQIKAEDLPQKLNRIVRLRRDGVRVALSSVQEARSITLPARSIGLEFVKIDRDVMLLNEADRRRRLQTIVAACNQLDLEVIADGVEGPGQYHAIGRAKIDLAQGFFLGKAIGADRLPAFFSRLQWWR
ncbi:EAL domain-containing protein [Burkholderia sp. WAC0059]|uniref:EAL domain-containing protein n=1 Tax=Burkholderia sp. WAC0059 TaxID=2066022 RepID=UPI0015E119B1|nr:EAL domain-containing protein [Burkholderia sp. WAC0059]